MEVLELGGRTGSNAMIHAAFVKHLRAIDISANIIAVAKAKVQDINKVTFEQLIIEKSEV